MTAAHTRSAAGVEWHGMTGTPVSGPPVHYIAAPELSITAARDNAMAAAV